MPPRAEACRLSQTVIDGVNYKIGGGGGNRTRGRKPYTVRTTCLAWLFELRLAPANRQAGARLAASTDLRAEAATPRREADLTHASLPLGSLAPHQTSAASNL